MSTDAAAPTIPTDEDGLTSYIENLPPADRHLVADNTPADYDFGPTDWHRYVVSLTAQIERVEEIERERRHLREALHGGMAAVRRAIKVHARLVEMYDVEYAEGGDLLTHYLAEADRAVRTAIIVNPAQ